MFGLTPILAALTPWERVQAVRDGLNAAAPRWQLWLPAVGAVVAGLVLIYVYRHWYDRRRVLRSFVASAAGLGLTHAERTLLARMAALAGLRRVDAIFSLEAAFDRGAERYLTSRRIDGLSDEGRVELTAAVDSLREKLGFAQESYARQRESAGLAFHRPGTPVRITRRARPGVIQASIKRADQDGVTVDLATAVDIRPGEAWRVRHVDSEAQQWEFDAAVVAGVDRQVLIRLIGDPRCINLRRSVRVPTHLPAYLALFPFVKGTEGAVPQFVSGTLTEIGGPGLRIDSTLQTRVGDRVLAIVRGHDERIIQGVAKVRRLLPGAGGVYVTVVEMVGLADDEVGELVQETNRAARRAQLAPAAPAAAFQGAHP